LWIKLKLKGEHDKNVILESGLITETR
jgi:hypothetical protein